MEKKSQAAVGIFRSKTRHINNHNTFHKSTSDKRMVGSDDSVFSVSNNSVVDGLYENIKLLEKTQEMASIKLGWILLNWIGIPLYLYTWALSIWNVDETKQWILLGLSLIFGVIKSWDAYENARKKKIQNDSMKYDIEKEHRRDDLKTTRNDKNRH